MMVSVPSVKKINHALSRENEKLDKEIVDKFFRWARMATVFFQEHGMPTKISSSDKENMDFLLWPYHGQLIGYDIRRGKTLYQALGLYKGESIEIFPDKLIIRTYAPDGKLGRYEGRGTEISSQEFIPAEGPLTIPAEDISKFLDAQAELWLGDLGVEKRLGPDRARILLRTFEKSTQIVPPERAEYRGVWY